MDVYRIGVDEWFRIPSVEDVFALGDCAGFLEQTGKQVLPALAQVRYVIPLAYFIFVIDFETNRLNDIVGTGCRKARKVSGRVV